VNKSDFKHVYWICGSNLSGKTTIASGLAADYGFDMYDDDLTVREHVMKIEKDVHPAMWEIWQNMQKGEGSYIDYFLSFPPDRVYEMSVCGYW
jgi:hypothetical protein